MSVKDRLKKFIYSQGLTISAFEMSILSSNGYVNSISRSMGLDKLEILIEKYPNLNIIWLLTGKGEMSLNEASLSGLPPATTTCQACKEKDERIADLKDHIVTLRGRVAEQKAKIISLEKASAGEINGKRQTA